MINYDDLARLTTKGDDEASAEGLDAILQRLDISVDGAMGVAQQRSLRMYLITRGLPLPTGNIPTPVSIDPKTGPQELSAFSAVWLDGFITGLRVWEEFRPKEGHRRT